jgi:hypothetical protein
MPLNHQDNGVSMGGSLKEVSTQNKLCHFGGPKRQAKLVGYLAIFVEKNDIVLYVEMAGSQEKNPSWC